MGKEYKYDPSTNVNNTIDHNAILNSKGVLCVETNRIYSSYSKCVIDMSNIYNIKFWSSHIGAVCRGERKTHKGFHFKNMPNEDGTLDLKLERYGVDKDE